jgi:hypothetical protein
MPIIMASQSKTAEHHPSPKGGALKIRGLKPKKSNRKTLAASESL